MNLHQAMTIALSKMKMGGLSVPFGANPTTKDEAKLQVDAYLVALNAATKRKITPEGLDLTAEMFLSGRVKSVDPAKFPSAPEFARAFSDAMDSQFMCIGVPDGPNTVRMIEIRRDTPATEVRKIIEANTPKVLAHGNLEMSGLTTKDEFSRAGKKLLSKMTADVFEPTDEDLEVERQRQIDELRMSEAG